jgi:predicted Ser/Thr protein kinase
MTDFIPPFRLIRSLGVGNSGEVFLAERAGDFTQRVAIKLMAAPDQRDDAAHEARILVALDHPYIVKLIDRGVLADGRPYLVMEYIDGEPIDAYAARLGLPVTDRVRLLIKVMEALSFAHRHLIVHADLKPANILVTRQGNPVLLDFGVAQREGAAGSLGHTPQYASPEQAAAARITAASDVYSAGLIADRLLGSGRGPDLDAIVRAATRSDPGARYASIDAFRADLKHFLDGGNISAGGASRSGALRWLRRHRRVAVAGLIIAATFLIAAVGVIRGTATAATQRAMARRELHGLVALTGTLEGELYDSVGTLPRGGPARQVLLRGTRDTLDALAARDSQDSRLMRELAGQYATLARLQAAEDEAGATGTPREQARLDLDHGIALLHRIPHRDAEYSAAQLDLAALLRARAAL